MSGCAHTTEADERSVETLLRMARTHVDQVLLATALRGGAPGTAVLVFTDAQNAGWFYPPGTTLPGLAVLAQRCGPAAPLTLSRRQDELRVKLRAECPECAAALAAGRPGCLPVYVRIGAPRACLLGWVPWPEGLTVVARAVCRGEYQALHTAGAPS